MVTAPLTFCPEQVEKYIKLEDVVLVNYCINRYFKDTGVDIESFWDSVLVSAKYKSRPLITPEYSYRLVTVGDLWIDWSIVAVEYQNLHYYLRGTMKSISISEEFKDVLKNTLNPVKSKLILPRLSKVYKQLGVSL